MNLFEAQLKWSRVLLQLDKAIEEDNKEQIQEKEAEVANLGNELASYPSLLPHMQCWIINIEGQGNINKEELNLLLKGSDVSEIIDGTSMLAERIKATLSEEGWRITDQAVSADRWRLGVACNDQKAFILCEMLHSKYATEIAAGAIKVKKVFDGFRFSAVPYIPDAKEFIKKSAN